MPQAPHFNYVGDSILGYKAHLGAGVKISNFNSVRRQRFRWRSTAQPFDTGLRKFGALLGDRCEIGCNAVLNPGSIIGRGSIIYPNVSWRGILPERMIVKNKAAQEIVARRRREQAGRKRRDDSFWSKTRPAGKPARPRSKQVGKSFRRRAFCPNRATSNTARSSRKWPWPWRGRWRSGEHLIVEAGTGVGKSLAYLIPAILFAVAHHKKAVISTHTINLQEQLIDKDLPMLAKILPVKFNFTMLKGRQIIFARAAWKKPPSRPASFSPRPKRRNCGAFTNGPKKPKTAACRISRSSRTRGSGSRSVPNAACARPKPCGHSLRFCEDGGRACFFQQARSRMLSADVLVLNHTLVLHASGRIGGGDGGRHIVQE